MLELSLPLWGDALLFAGAALAITVAGTKLAGYADRLADRTGLGEALTGSVLLGLMTALPGLAASVYAAAGGHPVLALTNALGGIAFQTAVLAVADITHRDANLEHAAASIENMMQTIMLIFLMALVLAGLSGPEVTVAHVHPLTPALLLAAALGYRLVWRVRERPMWKPERTAETVEDVPEPDARAESLPALVIGTLVSGAITLLGGVLIAECAADLVDRTPIPEAVVGGLLMAVTTSMPELVTCVAAVRRGALTLAVGDIVGGNFFDVLFVAAADIAYLRGSIYHADGVGNREIFVTCLTILLNVLLLAGLIYRQKHGPGNIGFESALMLALYAAGFLTLAFAL